MEREKMDTSVEYIKMCEKAEEIQSLRWPDFFAGDWFISFHGYPMVIGSVLPADEDLHRRGEIWLPRQDQLQKLLSKVKSVYQNSLPERVWTLQSAFNKFTHELYTHEECDNWTSMEQLWLAFVMSEKYNKVWNGNEWIDK
jgi:hypothetical protein